ncbi:MAG: metabolite traffic protein EboE [Phycisphaerales bacterium]
MLPVGYCTNVHPGRNLDELRRSLLGPVARVARRVGTGPLPVGVWLSAEATRQLHEQPSETERLRDAAMEVGVQIAAVNAFPYGNFGAASVKTRVYEPHWADARRALHTIAVAELLPSLVAQGVRHASVSTLPLGWRPRFSAEGCGASVGLASAQIEQVARALARIESRTGLHITLDIEPEPGCAIQTVSELAGFIRHCLRPTDPSNPVHRHVGACLDACHLAVMDESPDAAMAALVEANVSVHRVHVSSALRGDASEPSLEALARFDEPRFLHQVVTGSAQQPRVYEDIPDHAAARPGLPWRCHFHVPIFMHEIAGLSTTRDTIEPLLRTVLQAGQRPFIEVETYAWDRLPGTTETGVEEGLAHEILHARSLLAKCAPGAHAPRG